MSLKRAVFCYICLPLRVYFSLMNWLFFIASFLAFFFIYWLTPVDNIYYLYLVFTTLYGVKIYMDQYRGMGLNPEPICIYPNVLITKGQIQIRYAAVEQRNCI